MYTLILVMQHDEENTYSEKRDQSITLQIARPLISKFGPDFLESTHFFTCNGLRPARELEDIGETLDDNT